MVSRRGKVAISIVVVVVGGLLLLDRLVDLWTSWLWFGEVGYSNVFGEVLRTRALLFVFIGRRSPDADGGGSRQDRSRPHQTLRRADGRRLHSRRRRTDRTAGRHHGFRESQGTRARQRLTHADPDAVTTG
jgi:Uncharacterised protein family (UPF0182)